MSSHAMRTVAVSVMTLSFKAYTVGFALWAGTMPPPVPPVHGRRSWRLLLLLVDVLDDLGIGAAGGGSLPCPGVLPGLRLPSDLGKFPSPPRVPGRQRVCPTNMRRPTQP